VQRNWLRLLRCSGAGESLRGCESGGDGEETRRRRRVGKKVQQQLERERASLVLLSQQWQLPPVWHHPLQSLLLPPCARPSSAPVRSGKGNMLKLASWQLADVSHKWRCQSSPKPFKAGTVTPYSSFPFFVFLVRIPLHQSSRSFMTCEGLTVQPRTLSSFLLG
jgi:hypothetical protein